MQANGYIQFALIFMMGLSLISTTLLTVGYLSLRKTVIELRIQDVDFDLIADANMAIAANAVIMVDDQGVIEKANAWCYAYTGWEDTLVGKHISVLIPQIHRSAHASYFDRYMERPRIRQMGVGLQPVLLHFDGYEIPIEVGLHPITKGDGSAHVFAQITKASTKDRSVEVREFSE